jgi:hypothetical protein
LVPLAVEVEQEVTIVAAPGTGKTITLLQFATHFLASNSIAPLYFAKPFAPTHASFRGLKLQLVPAHAPKFARHRLNWVLAVIYLDIIV